MSLVVALGVRFGATAVGLGAVMASLLAFPLLYGGFLGFLQAREKT